MSDYSTVKQVLAGGAPAAMLCATCPWDRSCVSPPTMTSAQVDAEIEKATATDLQRQDAAIAAGGTAPMPTVTLVMAAVYAGKDTSAQVCPVFALRLRSGSGRGIADSIRATMQGWDDQK